MPNFTYTRMVSKIIEDAEIIEEYEISGNGEESYITIYKSKNRAKLIYHLSPPEYNLSEEQHMLLIWQGIS